MSNPTQAGSRLSPAVHHTGQVPKPSHLALQAQGTIKHHQHSSHPSINQGSTLPQEALIDELEQASYALSVEQHGHLPSSALDDRLQPGSIDGGDSQDQLGVQEGQHAGLEADTDYQEDYPGEGEEEANGEQQILLSHVPGHLNQTISDGKLLVEFLYQIPMRQAEKIILSLSQNNVCTLKDLLSKRVDSQRTRNFNVLISLAQLIKDGKRKRLLERIELRNQYMRYAWYDILLYLLMTAMIYLIHFAVQPGCQYSPQQSFPPLPSNFTPATNATISGGLLASLRARQSQSSSNHIKHKLTDLYYHFILLMGCCIVLETMFELVWNFCWVWYLKRKIDKL